MAKAEFCATCTQLRIALHLKGQHVSGSAQTMTVPSSSAPAKDFENLVLTAAFGFVYCTQYYCMLFWLFSMAVDGR